jgi:hypothetical protein
MFALDWFALVCSHLLDMIGCERLSYLFAKHEPRLFGSAAGYNKKIIMIFPPVRAV